MTIPLLATLWLHFAVVAAMVLAVAGLTLRWLSQPVDRIRVIQLTLAAVAVLPLWIAFAPAPVWRWEVASAATTRDLAASVTPVDARTAESPPWGVGRPTTAIDAPLADSTVDSIARPASPSEPASSLGLPLIDPLTGFGLALIAAHLAAATYFAIEWRLGLRRLRRLVSAAAPASPEVHAEWRRLTQSRGEGVRLLVSLQVSAPFAYGLLRPAVVLPQPLVDAGGSSLAYCLAHEWSHIVRGDLRWQLVLQLMQFVLWPQPAFWMLRRELHVCQDLLADDLATADGRDPVSYAELLLTLARRRSRPLYGGALTLLDRPRALTRRVATILTKPAPWRDGCSRRFTVGAAVVLLALAALLGGVRIESAEAQPPATNQPKPAVVAPAVQTEAGEKDPTYRWRVADGETGEPLPDAAVEIKWGVNDWEAKSEADRLTMMGAATRTSDADGYFEFAVPKADAAHLYSFVEVGVSRPGYITRRDAGGFFAGMARNRALGLPPFKERIELWKAAEVTGRLVGPNGAPVANAEVIGAQTVGPIAADGGRLDVEYAVAKSGADGRFKLEMRRSGAAMIGVFPEGFVALERLIGERRGELGHIPLQEGLRVNGRLLAGPGKIAANVGLGIYDETERKDRGPLLVKLDGNSPYGRLMVTDGEGRFSFGPLPPGEYRVVVLTSKSTLPGEVLTSPAPEMYVQQRVTLKAGAPPAPLEFHPTPHVVVRFRCVDSRGQAWKDFSASVSGKVNGVLAGERASAESETNGLFAARAPRGATNPSWNINGHQNLSTPNGHSWRYRLRPGEPLRNYGGGPSATYTVSLPDQALDDDYGPIEVVRYEPPHVVVSIVDERGRPIEQGVALEYRIKGGGGADLESPFHPLSGGRWLASSLLPDDETTFTVKAPGYEPATQQTSFKEGEQRELTFKLKAAK